MNSSINIALAIFSVILIYVIFKGKKHQNSLEKSAHTFAKNYYPENVYIASAVYVAVVACFDLDYQQITNHSNFWNDYGIVKHDSHVSDLSFAVSTACNFELEDALFLGCDTFKDAIDIAIRHNLD